MKINFKKIIGAFLVVLLFVPLFFFGFLFYYKSAPPEHEAGVRDTTVVEWCLNQIFAGIDYCKDVSSTELALISMDRISADTLRHYYPVKQGDVLSIAYEIKNSSDTTLVIQEIQTSCGCLVSKDDLPLLVLPKTSGYVHVDFYTEKNSGYVFHYIDCYGNIRSDDSCIELRFDTHVVPPADYTRDYEDLWHEKGGIDAAIRDFVNGKPYQKGYWLDSDMISN